MEPAIPAAAAAAATAPGSALALTLSPALPQEACDLSHPSPLLPSEQEAPGNERGTCLWRPWLSSTNDLSRQVSTLVGWAAHGTTADEATKANAEFHHPVRLFWPKSRSFDYLYSAGEILLHNFPAQATINLYEDSNSEEEEEEDDEEEDDEEEREEANEKRREGCVRLLESTPHQVTAHPPSPPLTSPN
ncbi:protein ripply1 [Perognathus longimembris pacificus]|uniref:protein ripply1 n=1 Tax=Perognathus longimembris pacificus TaxID=214514 RepID=UPI002019072B|nr:protein ripply1 [Perognathus longimembris pacificus]